MKEKIKKFFSERKELLIFIGILSLVFTSVIFIGGLVFNKDESDPQVGITINPTDDVIHTDPIIEQPVVNKFRTPVSEDAKLIRNYYDSRKTADELETAVIINGKFLVESTGVSYANADDTKINVYAIYDGKVIDIIESESYGTVLTIDHGEGVISRYSSLEEINVKQGKTVKAGELIGTGGTSIFDSEASNHIMLEVIVNGTYVDPLEVYNKEIKSVSAMIEEGK